MNDATFAFGVDRIPPNNLDAEAALLGAIIADSTMFDVAAQIVQPSDFYASLHESIFLAMHALREQREAFFEKSPDTERGFALDKVALATELRERGMLDKIGGMAYLNSLAEKSEPTFASTRYHAEAVHRESVARAMIEATREVSEHAYSGSNDIEALVASAVERFDGIARSLDLLGERWSSAGRTAADIARDGIAPVEFDVEGLLASEDGPCIIVGPPESYKTWLALLVMIAVLTGTPFAGRYRTRRRAFGIFINLDAGRPAIERRVYLTGYREPNLLVTCPDEWDWLEFERLLAAHPGAFIVIDCFSDVFRLSPDQDPAEAMRAFLRRLRRLFAKYACNGFVVDHSKRQGTPKASPEFYGSVQKKAAIRQMWIVEPIRDDADPTRAQVKVVSEKLSEAEKFSPFSVEFSFTETSIEVSFTGASSPMKTESNLDRMLARIAAEGPVTRSQMGADSGNRPGGAKDCWRQLTDKGAIVKTGTKVGKSELWWTPDQINENVLAGTPLHPRSGAPGEEHDNGAVSSRVRTLYPPAPGAPGNGVASALASAESGATPVPAREVGAWVQPLRRTQQTAPTSRPEDLVTLPVARDGFTIDTLPCSNGGHAGRLHPSDATCKACDPKATAVS